MLENDIETKGVSDESRIYEVGYHLVPTFSTDEAVRQAEELKSEVIKFGGEIISEASPSRVRLAYSMEKLHGNKRARYSEGLFGWIKFISGGRTAEEVELFFRNHDSVVRSLIVKTVREDTYFKNDEESEEVYYSETNERKQDDSANEKKENIDEAVEDVTDVDKKTLDERIDELVIR